MVVLEDFWNFYPETWGNDPAYFSVGWFNHQLESVIFLAKNGSRFFGDGTGERSNSEMG